MGVEATSNEPYNPVRLRSSRRRATDVLGSSTSSGRGRPRAGADWVDSLDAVSRNIRDPVAKLRFIRTSLARYQRVDRWLRMVPYAPLRRALYKWLHLEGLQYLLAPHPLGAPFSLDPSARNVILVGRASLIFAATVTVAAIGLGIYRFRPAPASAAAPATAPALSAPMPAPSLMPFPPTTAMPRAGVAPEGIWLVEQGSDWEQYSSGLRIETSYAVAGDPRRYRVFSLARGPLDTWHQEPVGLVFHTSESDIWPLEAEFNENLRESSHRLLKYVRRNKLYNYLIDRFGRVYRVVDERSKANHAGHSVWAHGDHVYLNLNNAFLGVSFETRWEGGRALPITEAQFAAGRAVADYLRQRYQIAPEMCVAHGLASVNPKKHLIGHHLDWARGFPFEAFGLPDQYKRPAPAVALFGFGYDDDFIKVLGEPWEGVGAAERGLAQEAEGQGQGLDEIRKQRQDLYDRWIRELSREDASR